jgi:hypothetical protein
MIAKAHPPKAKGQDDQDEGAEDEIWEATDIVEEEYDETEDQVDVVAALLVLTQRERERERESFIRNNLHNGVVSGAARGQALRGPMWAGLTPDSKGDPTGDQWEAE